ncbi:hypothetical protein [Rhizobium sp. YK2]|uniref:hypothetical protein n=1 Tax=Rhizobium sp. YK2 TaxID=1860096 RepID=UPI00084C2E87|nr:hypothetical protein [Rhizobium sp. YK2]OEC93611.1 hypothetical protein A9Z06_09310 [Rhizobium sp. YK2]
MKPTIYALIAATSFSVLGGASAFAQQGYKLTPVLTYKNVSHDPEGLWDDSDLQTFGAPPRLPSIYIARITTPRGEWILSQLDSACTMQGDCQFVLALKKPGGEARIVASGNGLLGHPVTLSLNYAKIFTEEINDSVQPFTGSYDVKDAR